MLPVERKTRILEVIRKKELCTIAELARRFSVSTVTIHRVLSELQDEGIVTKTRGGVRLLQKAGIEKRFDIRLRDQFVQKQQIAKSAAGFINEGDSIFLDASTTCYYLLKIIVSHQKRNITVVSNSPIVGYELSSVPDIHYISTGGELQYQVNALTGPFALSVLSGLHFDKAFLSASAVALDVGTMTTEFSIAEIRRQAALAANQIFFLLDSTKFSKVAPMEIVPLTRISTIITDSELPVDVAEAYRERGVDIVCTSEES